MRKYVLSAIALSLAILTISINIGKTKESSYYSGDALYYKNRLIIASSNTGRLEFFALAGERVEKLFAVSLSADPSKEEVFNDVRLDLDGGQLKAYAVAGYTLYKYDISDLFNAKLEKKVKNTYWDWYYRVDRFGNNIATISKRGVKVWNQQMDVIDSYEFEPESAYSVRSGGSDDFIYSLKNSGLSVYDRESRKDLVFIPLNYSNFAKNGRKPFVDRITGDIFVADDYYVKQFSSAGKLMSSYRHSGENSYDAESYSGSPYVFASNGRRVMKLDRDNLSLVKEVPTSNLGVSGGWAMGMKLVNTAFGDRLVVFNNSSIVVLDNNLKLVATAGKITQDDNKAYPVENLFLYLSNNSAQAGAAVILNGGGFWPNEELNIKLDSNTIKTKADRFGRFQADVTVPAIKAGRYDIKVDGVASNLTYSISFEVK